MKLDLNPKFMVSSCDGGLYDTSKMQWHLKAALRPQYSYVKREITTTKDLLSTLRATGNFCGMFLTSDCELLSHKSVIENLYQVIYSMRHNINDGWKVIGYCSSYELEGENYCAHSGEQITE